MTMSPFWKNALPLVAAGVVLTILASVANFMLSKATVDGFMNDWIARNGFSGSTDLSLAILLTNLMYYPILVGIVLIFGLPFFLGFHPEWARHRPSAAALILVPTLLIGALWWAGPSLFVIYTLPAMGFMAVSAAILVRKGGRATS